MNFFCWCSIRKQNVQPIESRSQHGKLELTNFSCSEKFSKQKISSLAAGIF